MSLFEPRGTASSGGPASALPRLSPWPEPLSPQQLREWFAQRTRLRSGAAGAGGSAAGGTGAGGARATSLGGAGVPAGAEGTGGAGAAGPGGACTRGTGASGAGGVGGARAGGAGAGDPGVGGPGAGGTGTGGTGAGGAGARGAGVGDPAAGDAGAGDPGACGAGAGGAGAGDTGAGGAGAIDPGVGGAGIGGAVSGGTDSFKERREPKSRSASPVRTVHTGHRVPRPRPPPVPSTHIMALRPSSVPLGECALGTDVLEDKQEDFECLAAAVPHLVAMLLAPEGELDAPDILTPRSYADWVKRVKRLPGSPPVLKARYVARGFDQRQGVDFFQTFSSTPKMTTLRVLLHVAAQRDYELHSQVLQCFGFRYSSPQSTPLPTGHSLSAPPSDESVEPSGPYPELVGCLMYLMTCTQPDLAYPLSILARYVAPGRQRPEHWEAAKRVLCYLCSTSGMWLVLGGPSPVVLTGHADASWVYDSATQRSSQGYTFSLGSSSVSWRSTRSSSVLSSSCEAEIYAGAMAAQELRWLTYLLTDLGE
ncbi:unnamed protein product [Closterium sp. NIES-53]